MRCAHPCKWKEKIQKHILLKDVYHLTGHHSVEYIQWNPFQKALTSPPHALTWMDLQDTVLSEISLSQGDKRCMNTLTTPSIWSGQSHRHRKHKGGCQRQGHREMGVCAPRRWSSTFARSLQLRVCCLTMRIQLTYWKVHFEIAQMVNFTFCVF